jgi:hypothetical protein
MQDTALLHLQIGKRRKPALRRGSASPRRCALTDSRPGVYVIIDEATGERVFTAGDEEA